MNSNSQPTNFLSNASIFLDTNVFIDAYEKPEPFYQLFSELETAENTFLTINSIYIEFLKGSRSVQEYDKKKDFMNQIVDTIYPTTKEIEENALKLSLLYQSYGGKTAVTDFYLAAILFKYKDNKNVFLMTKNHHDFPTNIFDRTILHNIQNGRDVQTFGFYRFNTDKYNSLLDRIL